MTTKEDLQASRTRDVTGERASALAKLKSAKKSDISTYAIDAAYKKIAQSDYITWGDNAWKTMRQLGHDGFASLYKAAGPYQVNADLLRRVIEARKSRKSIAGWLVSGFKSKDDLTGNLSANDLDQLGLLLWNRLGELRDTYNRNFDHLKRSKPELVKETEDKLVSRRGDEIDVTKAMDSSVKKKGQLQHVNELSKMIHLIEDAGTSKEAAKNVKNMALVPHERLTLPKLKEKIREYFRTFDHLPAGLTEKDLLNRVLAKKKKFTGNTLEYILADEIDNLSRWSTLISVNTKPEGVETDKEKQEAVIQTMLHMMEVEDPRRRGSITALRATLLANVEFHGKVYGMVKEAVKAVAEADGPGSYAGALHVVGKELLDKTDEILKVVPELATKVHEIGGLTPLKEAAPIITRDYTQALAKLVQERPDMLSTFVNKMGAATTSLTALAGKAAAAFAALSLGAKVAIGATLAAGGAAAYAYYRSSLKRGKKILGITEGFTQKENHELIYDLGVKSLASEASLHINASVRKILKDKALRESVSGALTKALSHLESDAISAYGLMEDTRLQKMTMEMRKCFVYGKCVKGQDSRNFFTAYVDYVNNVFRPPTTTQKDEGLSIAQLDKNKAEFTERYNAWKAKHFPEKKHLPAIEPPPPLLQLPAPDVSDPDNKVPPPPGPEPGSGDGERQDPVPMPIEPDIKAAPTDGGPSLPDAGSGTTPYDPMAELNEFYKTYFHNPSRPMSGTKRKAAPTTCPTTAGPTAAPTTQAPTISQVQSKAYKAIFSAIGRCLQVAPPDNINDKADVDRFWKEAEVKAIEDGRFHNIIGAISAAAAAWAQGVSLPRIVASLISAGVISLINGVWTCMASKPVKKPKLVHPHCPPGGIPRGEPGSGACPPHSGGLLPNSKQKEIDPYREGTVLSADLQVPEEEDIKAQAGEGRFDEKGAFTTQPVQPVTGDKDLRLVSNSTELDAINEQRLRESLTALGLLDLLALNQQNRPLPEQLRQSRTIYYGGPQSGFSDPLTNPFSKFVWKAKADRYYVKPTDSVNAFRRQVWRQKMINLGMNEIRQYPEAAKRIAAKEAMEFPKLNGSVSAHEQEKLFRPSYYFPQSGITGLQNAHARYHKLPARAERLTTNMPVDKSSTHYGNRIDNYEKQNDSVTIQDAEEVFPFQRPRRLQGGEWNS